MDATPILAQYGALGVMVIAAGLAVRVLFQRTTEAYERERERADRMEQEVQRLNAVIQEKMLPILHEATRAISDALQEQRRRDR
jgi:hypothetical protein